MRFMNNWMGAEIAHQNGLLDPGLYKDMIGDARHNMVSYPQLKNIFLNLFENYPHIKEMNIFWVAFDDD